MPYLLLTLNLILLLVGCASKQDNPPYEKLKNTIGKKSKPYVPSDLIKVSEIPQFEELANVVAPGFLFSLQHPSDEKLRGTFRVYFDGILRLPYGIRINTKGKTFGEVKKEVLAACDAFFQRGSSDVIFDLIKKEYWVEVRGFVKKSGYYLVSRKESLDKVIDKAGGLSGNLKQDFFMVSIRQQEKTYSISLNQYYDANAINSTLTWTGGDTLFINLLNEDVHTQAVPTVSVIGGVMNPGKFLYKENASIFYYISKSGGVIPNVGYEEAFLIRKTEDDVERIKFNITDMDTIPAIQQGDVIMLNSERRTFSDKLWERSTQVGALLTTIALIILAL